MLQFFHGTNIPFMKYRRMAYFFSGALVLATALWLVVKGPRYGVDFTGGTLLTLRTSQVIHADEMRNALDAAGLKGFELQQGSGADATQYMLRIPTTEQKDV